MEDTEDDAPSSPLPPEFIINDLPEEILERVLSYLSPYNEVHVAARVCRLWRRLIQGVVLKRKQAFVNAACEGVLKWSSCECPSTPVTGRNSHSVAYINGHIYFFGGCSGSRTAFNDMWNLDLSTREWTRVLASGSYPSPKGSATMVNYKGNLILFGGLAPPVPHPPHLAPQIFNELHVYRPHKNKWSCVATSPSPPPMAGHSASIVGSKMVVFGGLLEGQQRSNSVWVLDVQDMSWREIETRSHDKPRERYGHEQVVIDDKHVLIIGGCTSSQEVSHNQAPLEILSDAWLLDMSGPKWRWQEMRVCNEEFAAPQIWQHPACKVGDTVLIYSTPRHHKSYGVNRKRNHVTNTPSPTRPHMKQTHKSSRDQVQSSHRGQNNLQSLFRRGDGSGGSGRSAVSGIKDSMNGCTNCEVNKSHKDATPEIVKPKYHGGARPKVKVINGLKGLTKSVTLFDATITESTSDMACLTLLKCKCRPEAQASPYPWPTSGPQPKKSTLQLYVLDISQATTQGQVSWLPVPDSTHPDFHERPISGVVPSQHGPPPDSTIMASLSAARGELVMFGGLVENRSQTLLRGRGSSASWDYKAVNKIYFSF
ncbi:F-box only protein 42-like isoform X1 [Lytechinus variegatus]|uniref:F-box only protein 42-like isoform X1 n=1 Tax=Lytechinus variegatus TaxID=7654 RepID=UPI001BB23D48|nr:F-box only protein 42-like isoform X1 [Lytechinus variegatus]